jgi:hypothetical protein
VCEAILQVPPHRYRVVRNGELGELHLCVCIPNADKHLYPKKDSCKEHNIVLS